mmetsp:Transcript_6791/g.10320  ORF Transcript_6791/g.10320 Transcript_6791/m.10320 type:complete len:85 (-) Transcript_6791:684-938(-)
MSFVSSRANSCDARNASSFKLPCHSMIEVGELSRKFLILNPTWSMQRSTVPPQKHALLSFRRNVPIVHPSHQKRTRLLALKLLQ